MLENPAPFSLNFSSPMTYSSKERFYPHSPFSLNQTLQTKRIPLKTSVHFPITITVCKHWSKFITCSPSPRDCGGVSHPKDIVIMVFDYAEQNGYLKILIR